MHRLAERVEIESDPPLPLSIDGELCEGPRFTFEVFPGSLRVLAGPGYVPVPVREPAIEDEEDESVPAPEASPLETPRGFVPRVFGLLTGMLLLAKRMPGAYLLVLGGIAVAVLVFAWLANGAVGGRWEDANAAGLASVRATASS